MPCMPAEVALVTVLKLSQLRVVTCVPPISMLHQEKRAYRASPLHLCHVWFGGRVRVPPLYSFLPLPLLYLY